MLFNERIVENQTISQINSYLTAAELKVPAGEVSGSITINTIDDESYETTESITISYGTPTNANIGAIEGSQINILDNDPAPVVSFELSNDNIVENSSENVTLTATLSIVSGYETIIPLTISDLSTASTDEYTVSALSISIPAGSLSGTVTVSTETLDDTAVEMLETIIFIIGEITNASSETTDVTLMLESDDDPNLVSVVAEPLEFAEHESSLVTATIDEVSSRDVYIPFNISGTANANEDYSYEYESAGEEALLFSAATINHNNFDVLDDGRIVSIDGCCNLTIYESDGSYTNYGIPDYMYDMKVVADQIILRSNQKIYSFSLTTLSFELLRELTSNNSFSDFDFVNDKLYTVYSSNGFRVFESQSQGQDPVLIGQFSGWPGDGLEKVVVNSQEEVFAARSDGLWKIVDSELVGVGSTNVNNESGEMIFLQINNDLKSLRFNNDKLYASVYDSNQNANIISQIDVVSNVSTADPEDEYNNNLPLKYTPLTYILGEDVQTFYDFDFDSSGKLVLSVIVAGGELEYRNYKNSPEIKISSGNLTGTIAFNGIEDDLNAPGEETDETIVIDVLTPINAITDEASPVEDITLTILNNEISLTLDEVALANVPSMSNTSVAWGDYDRDGDQDMAIMGFGFTGVVTRLYENNNGVFVLNDPGLFSPTYSGDLMWVDYNKDGYIDLVVSGLDPNGEPSTIIYQNIDGFTFAPSTDLTMPNLFNTSMDSGDLDGDGDIDFVINGVNSDDEWKKYIYMREGTQLVMEEDFQNYFGGDIGNEYGIVGIADNNVDGDLDIFLLNENNSRVNMNTFILDELEDLGGNYLPGLYQSTMEFFGDYLYMMGEQNGETKFFIKDLLTNDVQEISSIEGLKNGDIAIGDYNNDGYEDMVITGENSNGSFVSKLFNGTTSGFVENTEVELVGMINSTAKWVDYDSDGDLDLFMSGVSSDGDVTALYETNLLNKSNEPAAVISSLSFESLGNGKVRLSWQAPQDDFSNNLGYVLRLGTTESGSELSNTESNLDTGQRLITKSPQINTTSVEMLLDPGDYFWSVQSVDGALEGSPFSEEQSFQLTYEWKLLNQGGIIDRSISSIQDPIVKLTDIDGDNDMDLVYGSKSQSQDIQVFRLGDKNFEFFDYVSGASNISDIKFIDINDDLILDMLVNSWDDSNNNSMRLYNSTSEGGFNIVFEAPGLYEAKIELIDINNDGTQEIVHAGRTSELVNSQLKIFVYEQNGSSLLDTPLDISDQVATDLKQGAFGFGNIDQDADIDFAISGLGAFGAQNKVFLNETVYTETVSPIYELTDIDFPPAYESTLDFVDFDSDGDLDMIISGLGEFGPLFKVLSNNGLSGASLDFTEQEGTGLIPIRGANIDFGDYNGDGYTDMLYNGTIEGEGEVTKLVEYDPATQSYIDSDFDLSDIVSASIAFGDIDGDDDLDFTIAGESIENGNSIIKTYLNVRNESAEVIGLSAPGSRFMTSTSTDEFIVNEKPSKPEGLIAEQLNYDPESGYSKVRFSWPASTDDHTEPSGLSYAMRVGTNSGGTQIMKVNALPNGYRLSAGRGNVEQRLEWELNLPSGEYFWSVQAIDASFSGSFFGDEVTIQVGSLNPEMEASVAVIDDVATVTVNTTNFVIDELPANGGTGDGHWHYSLNDSDPVMVYTSGDTVLSGLPDGDHSILIWLVDNEHNPLDPVVEQTIEFSTDDGIIECGETVTYTQVASGNYTTSFTAPDGEVASVTVNAEMENNYDYIYVTDGAGNILNSDQTTGVFIDTVYSSTDGTISVNITNDTSIQNGDVTLAFSCADPCEGVTGSPAIADDFDVDSVDILAYTNDNDVVTTVMDGASIGGSGNVLQYIDNGGSYANVQISTCNKFDMALTNTFTMDVYIDGASLSGSQTNQVAFKLQDGTQGSPWESQEVSVVTIDAVDTWQTVVFDFTGTAAMDRTDFDNVVIQFNGENNNDTVTAYIDNLQSSNTLGLDDVNATSNFTFFPNPVNNVLTIKAQASIGSITVYNMLGQAVFRSTPKTNDITVDMSVLPSGPYFVQVSINNTVKTVRVIKN